MPKLPEFAAYVIQQVIQQPKPIIKMAKKKEDNTLLYGAIAIALLAAAGGTAAVAANNRLLVSFQNIKVSKEGRGIATKIVFKINYTITNNNPVDISMLDLFGTVYYQRNRVIDFGLPSPFTVKAGETKVLVLEERTSPLTLIGAGIQAIGTLIDNKALDLDVEVEGDITTDFSQLPAIPFAQTIPLIT